MWFGLDKIFGSNAAPAVPELLLTVSCGQESRLAIYEAQKSGYFDIQLEEKDRFLDDAGEEALDLSDHEIDPRLLTGIYDWAPQEVLFQNLTGVELKEKLEGYKLSPSDAATLDRIVRVADEYVVREGTHKTTPAHNML